LPFLAENSDLWPLLEAWPDLAEDTRKQILTGYEKSEFHDFTHQNSDFPQELKEIIARWNTLPGHIKQQIIEMVRSVRAEKGNQ